MGMPEAAAGARRSGCTLGNRKTAEGAAAGIAIPSAGRTVQRTRIVKAAQPPGARALALLEEPNGLIGQIQQLERRLDRVEMQIAEATQRIAELMQRGGHHD